MGTVARSGGWQVIVYANNHEPPHVHVRRAEGEMRVAIGVPRESPPTQYGQPRGHLRESHIREAVELVAARQVDCYEEWTRLHVP